MGPISIGKYCYGFSYLCYNCFILSVPQFLIAIPLNLSVHYTQFEEKLQKNMNTVMEHLYHVSSANCFPDISISILSIAVSHLFMKY